VKKDYGTFVYYITASLISIASVLLVLTTHKLKEQATYLSLTELVDEDFTTCPTDHDIQEIEPAQTGHVGFGVLWNKLKLIVLSIFLIFSITLIFPVFASVIQSNNASSGKWYFQKNVYIPFIYLLWNLGDLLGRILCGIPRCKMLISDPHRLIVYSVARLAFIPLFLTCNLHPSGGHSSAWIQSDLWYMALQFIFGLTNGQLCTSCFMTVRDYCDTDEEKEAAGGFTTVFLSVGLAAGAVLSYLLVWFIS
jgi:equilibrative nucleoside transporter 1/2/3